MKKNIRLTESELIGLVKRIIKEQSVIGAPNYGSMSQKNNEEYYYKKGDILKVNLKSNGGGHIIIKIINTQFNEPGNISNEFIIKEVIGNNMVRVNDFGNLETYDNNTYIVFFNNEKLKQEQGKSSEIIKK